MKIHLTACLAIIVAAYAAPVYCGNLHLPVPPPAGVEALLKTHRWTLIEMVQVTDKTYTDMTALMLPCEKDNYIIYNNDNTYHIMEGEAKCNASDNNIKGEGHWEYDGQDTSLIESYQNGKKIAKKLVFISDETFKIQYEGEGKKLITLTYLSETAKDAAKKQAIVYNVFPAPNIIQVIRECLSATGHYIMVPDRDVQKERPLLVNNSKGSLQTVAIMPFLNNTDENNRADAAARTNTLLAQAKKTGIDFIVTGVLHDVACEKGDTGFKGRAQYEVMVLDMARDTQYVHLFDSEGSDVAVAPGKAPKKGLLNKAIGFGKKAAEIGNKYLPGVTTALNASAPFLVQKVGLETVYQYYFISNAVSNTNNDVGRLFSLVSDKQRKSVVDSSGAILAAVGQTADNVISFLSEAFNIKIKITAIEGSGKKMRVVINAGSGMQLNEKDILTVVKMSTGSGKDAVIEKELGSIKVDAVDSANSAHCTIEDGRDAIAEAFNKTPGEVVVIMSSGSKQKNK